MVTLKLEPSSLRLGKFSPRTTAMVPTRLISGVMVTERAGMVTSVVPARCFVSTTRICRGPVEVAASVRGRFTEADQPPPLSTRTGSPPLMRDMGIGSPPRVIPRMVAPAVKPSPTRLMRWLATTVVGVEVTRGPATVITVLASSRLPKFQVTFRLTRPRATSLGMVMSKSTSPLAAGGRTAGARGRVVASVPQTTSTVRSLTC